MIFFGLLAIFQITILPGAIFLILFKPKGGFFFKVSVMVAISMLFNATIIYPMVYLHIYLKPVILGVIIAETIAIIWLLRKSIKIDIDIFAKEILSYLQGKWEKIKFLFKNEKYSIAMQLVFDALIIVIAGFAFSFIIWFFKRITNGIGTVFVNWDAIVSWNSWAQNWAQGKISDFGSPYPQLLPLNLSLTYLLIGNYELSLFAKAIMPIFALLTVLVVFELGIEQENMGYFFAVIFIYFFYKKFLGDIISDGYADVPVAFMGLIAIIPFLQSDDLIHDKKNYILSMLLAAAAALTKQTGLYIFALIPLMALLTAKNLKADRKSVIWIGLAALLILPWYLMIGIQILQGNAQSGFETYVNLSASAQNVNSSFTRPLTALLGMGKYFAFYALLIPAFFGLSKKYKLLIVLFVIPYSLLWGFLASYDTRNLAILFPTLCVLGGLGIERVIHYALMVFTKIKLAKIPAAFLLLLMLLPIIFLSFSISDEKVIDTWKNAQMQIFSPEINQQLYKIDFSNSPCKKIVTNYPIEYLPGLHGVAINNYFNDYNYYEKLISAPDVCWILIPGNALEPIKEEVQHNVDNGIYQLLFSTTKWIPYDLIKIK